MKRLTHYAIKVSCQTQVVKAIEFYRLATKRPFHPQIMAAVNWTNVGYVGLGSDPSYGVRYQRLVTFGQHPYKHETVVPFENLKMLADTPSRMRAYKKVFGK